MKPFLIFLWLLFAGSYACTERHKMTLLIDPPDYQKATSFLGRQNDSAFYYFNKLATGSKDSLLIARAYNNMAAIQSDAGDFYGSQESLLISLKYLNEQQPKDHWCFAADYNELGRNSAALKNFDQAIDYYGLALKFSQNEEFKTVVLNNKAVAYQQMRQYTQAIDIYQSIIDRSKRNKKEYARVISNLAKVRWLQDTGYQAAPALLTSLQIRKDLKDEWGLNASYAHLADYYSHTRPDSALFYADRMYATARLLNSPDDQLEALQKLIALSSPKTVKPYFLQYQSLNDSLQTARNAAKNQFALIRYEAQKNKADNLRLQKDNAEDKVQIILQQIFIGAIICFGIIVVFVLSVWYRRRKQRMERDVENAIRENQFKTSQKVHDVVAGGLYQVMTEIEYQGTIDKGRLLDKIEILYEQSRDISYEQTKVDHIDFQKVISDLLTPFAGPDIKISIVGNDIDLWRHMKGRIKQELKHVLQELMINMKKHSTARNVVVRFERQGDQLRILYTDDGVGLPSTFRYGNGLSSTENRIRGIGGQISFDKNITKGLKIQICLSIT